MTIRSRKLPSVPSKIRTKPFGKDLFDYYVSNFKPYAVKLSEVETESEEVKECKKFLMAGGVGYQQDSGGFYLIDMMQSALKDRHGLVLDRGNWVNIRWE